MKAEKYKNMCATHDLPVNLANILSTDYLIKKCLENCFKTFFNIFIEIFKFCTYFQLSPLRSILDKLYYMEQKL